jgi:glycosyltransferase involved in cell wall biosynthesis
MLSICAVIAVRNEAQYLQVLLPLLLNQGIEVVILDNGSTDQSHKIYAAYDGNPIIYVRHIPYLGTFSLIQQLEEKRKIFEQIKHDWVIHHDADEVFEHFQPGLTLRDAIQEADDNGFNALNFDEFVFLPEPDGDYAGRNYYKEMLRYYFFEPFKNRKNAVWKRAMNFDNRRSGGHLLSGDGLSFFPTNHVFRHYITLSQEHAIDKYLTRTFSQDDKSLGWHGNRLNFTRENLALPTAHPYLFTLNSYDSKDFRRDSPTPKHYWEWH